MIDNIIPPGHTSAPEKFIQENGEALAVVSLRNRTSGDTSDILDNIGSDFVSGLAWLSGEVEYQLYFSWQGTPEEAQELEALKNTMLGGDIEKAQELLQHMCEIIMKTGEASYTQILSFDNGAVEGEAGNNRMYQSARLLQCVLIGIRIGMDPAVLEKWKTKLEERDQEKLQKNIFPAK